LDHPLIGFLAVIGGAKDTVGENTAQNGFVLVMMGIYKAGHDYHAAGIDNQRRCIEATSDGEDLLSADQHVTGFDVADPRVQTPTWAFVVRCIRPR
jgi:hypothetical protein